MANKCCILLVPWLRIVPTLHLTRSPLVHALSSCPCFIGAQVGFDKDNV
ncbi:hypothetical protein MPTK1_2g05970 [Marchantia polymorpha subsp. ruderalis]|uniref:Uncharacterized protein n=1 Tax=Marchantia polymorpha TaxID=3197 RepID=A0A2R6XDK8_MARPO|nr:hypothetical protein MARPO_0021s0052 [Marchantia polymorpha]BBN01258.1 hypothetical protein Mp_2g05970 [Marchantia polymorpha subsp. ruderalis]|eukprot:PTQ44183.1 hypothetical protein MARPO_0021s0052 [Marchantia polymorpha]